MVGIIFYNRHQNLKRLGCYIFEVSNNASSCIKRSKKGDSSSCCFVEVNLTQTRWKKQIIAVYFCSDSRRTVSTLETMPIGPEVKDNVLVSVDTFRTERGLSTMFSRKRRDLFSRRQFLNSKNGSSIVNGIT